MRLNRERLMGAGLVAAVLLCTTTTTAFAQAASGKSAFAQCGVCHSTNGSNGVGPSLQGIVGRKAGTFPGFRYSHALKGSGITWDAKNLDLFLTDPQKHVPGNVMPYAGQPDATLRAALIAYLATLK